MPHALKPDEITPAQFAEYTLNWRQLSGDIARLNNCFMSSGSHLNYVYLTAAQITKLLAVGTSEICAKFALVPRQSDPKGALVFAIIFYSDDANNPPASKYQLSGAAEITANIEEEFIKKWESRIPPAEAFTGIKNWNQLAASGLNSSWFTTTKCGLLRGYAHRADDFREAMMGLAPPALWFNFALHHERGAVDSAKQIFDTVLARNVEPDVATPGVIKLSAVNIYYDVANPCPPACGVNDSGSSC